VAQKYNILLKRKNGVDLEISETLPFIKKIDM